MHPTRVNPRAPVVIFFGLLLAVVIAIFVPPRLRSKETRRSENAAALMKLSAVSTLTTQEQSLFDSAGSDPTRMQQAMLEIQKRRLIEARNDLDDAEERHRELPGPTGYRVYADGSAPSDFAALVNEDEQSAKSRIERFTAAMHRIDAWQPVGGGGAEGDAASSQEEASPNPAQTIGRQPGTDQDAPVRTPEPNRSDAQPYSQAAQVEAPADMILDEPNPKPSVTVYADGTPARRPSADETADVTEAPLADRTSEEEAIKATLRRWSAAMLLNDPHAEAEEYAPRMERYFLRRNVDKAFVEADKSAYLRRGNITDAFTIRDITIEEETDRTAAVRLVKDVSWQRGPEGETHKVIRSLLHLERFADGWKITGEQDFR